MIEWFHFTMAGNKKKRRRRRRRRKRGEDDAEEDKLILFFTIIIATRERESIHGFYLQSRSSRQTAPPMPPWLPWAPSYCIGGRRFRNTRQVHYFDVNRPTEGWKEASPMINPRSEAKVVTLHGKLYVFGGGGSDCGGDWAEVFEPCGPDDDGGGQGGQWTALPSPPSLPTHGYGCLFAVARRASNKIVVGLQIVLGLRQSVVTYEYDVAHNSWLDFKLNPSLFTLSQPVVAGNMLYWFDHELNAYNLDNKMLYSGPIEDLQIEHHLRCGDYLFTSSLLHLAEDRFCLLWVDPDGSLSRLHCTILQVSIGTDINGKGCLSASVLSCHSFILEFPLDFLDGLLM